MNKEVLGMINSSLDEESVVKTKPTSLVEQAEVNGNKLIESLIRHSVEHYRDKLWFCHDDVNLNKKWNSTAIRYSVDSDFLDVDPDTIEQAKEYNKQFGMGSELRNNGIFFCYCWENEQDNYYPIITNEDELKRYSHFQIRISPVGDFIDVTYTPNDIKKLLADANSGKLWKEGIYSPELINFFIKTYKTVKKKEASYKKLMTALKTNASIVYRDIYKRLLEKTKNKYKSEEELIWYSAKPFDDTFANPGEWDDEYKTESAKELFSLFKKYNIDIRFFERIGDEHSYLPVIIEDLQSKLKNDYKYGYSRSFAGCIQYYVLFNSKRIRNKLGNLAKIRVRKRTEKKDTNLS